MNKELSTEKTMTSVEIAEIAGKRHDHVLRDISKLSDWYVEMSLPKVGEGTYYHKNTGAQKHKLYYLTKIQTLDLMTGYNVELRIKINRRWEELEKNNSLPNFNNPVLAARAWADAEEKRQIAESARDRLIHSNKTFTASQIAKELNLKSATELNKILESKGVQFKQNNTWLLYSQYAGKGFTEIKEEEKNGTVIYYRRWTGLGRDWILGVMSDTKDIIEECRR